MKPTRANDILKLLSESPVILDAVQRVYIHLASRTPNKFPPLYDEFVGAMWRMLHLTELCVQGIGDLPTSLVDFMIHNRTLKRLDLLHVTIPPSTIHLQIPSRSYQNIQAASVTGDIEALFSNSSSTLQRIEIGLHFPMRVISFLSQSPTNRMSSLVELTISKFLTLTEEQASWVIRFLPCCPVLDTLSIFGKFPSLMSAIPPQALPRLRSLRTDEDGHALELLDSPIRRVSALNLTLKGPLVFRFLEGVQSQPTSISGEIAYACLITPNDNFHRLVQNCERFFSVIVHSEDPVAEVRSSFPENCLHLPFIKQIIPTARALTLMPSLQDISIIFRVSWQPNNSRIAKSWKKARAVQVIQHWLKQADQSCPLLQRLSIKVDMAGAYEPCFVFDCVLHQQDKSKKWRVRIWRECRYYTEVGETGPYTKWIANVNIAM